MVENAEQLVPIGRVSGQVENGRDVRRKGLAPGVPQVAQPRRELPSDVSPQLAGTVMGEVVAQPGSDIPDEVHRRGHGIGELQRPALATLIDQDKKGNAMAAPRQLLRHLISDNRPERLAADQVGAEGPEGQELVDIRLRNRFDGSEDIAGVAQIGRLDAEEGSFRAHVARQ